MTPYETDRRAARSKYAGVAAGTIAGGLLGAALPPATNSVWERPLRSLGGATLGAVLTREPDTGLGHVAGSVAGGILGGTLNAGRVEKPKPTTLETP